MLLILPQGKPTIPFLQEYYKQVGAYSDQLKDFDKKLEEMQGFIQKAQMQTRDAEERNRNNRLFG